VVGYEGERSGAFSLSEKDDRINDTAPCPIVQQGAALCHRGLSLNLLDVAAPSQFIIPLPLFLLIGFPTDLGVHPLKVLDFSGLVVSVVVAKTAPSDAMNGLGKFGSGEDGAAIFIDTRTSKTNLMMYLCPRIEIVQMR